MKTLNQIATLDNLITAALGLLLVNNLMQYDAEPILLLWVLSICVKCCLEVLKG